MRLPAYLCTSRHGIYYARLPLPREHSGDRRRAYFKFSLRTREPAEAARLARIFVAAGQSILSPAKLSGMRYDEMRELVREYFKELLDKHFETVAVSGPRKGPVLAALKNSRDFAKEEAEDFAELIHKDGAVGIIKDFCASKSIEIPQGADARTNLLEEYRKGYLAFTEEALRHSAELNTIALHEPATIGQPTAAASVETEDEAPQTAAFEVVVEQYFEEKLRGRALAPKTETEKRDALELLSELTSNKPVGEMTKQDAQKVKSALLKLPKHRNTNPRTRGKPLAEILKMTDLERMSSRTVNAYLGHMQSVFTWAVDNGYADTNVFNGLRIKASRRAQNDGRQAFTAEQLQRMFAELTDPNSSLVNKDMHRWVTLIGMFTGMRLNEIAQLEKSDIRICDGVLCIDINEDGDDKKSLKNIASRRLVPVHDTLLELGIEDFVERRQSYSHSRLFHELTYSPQNGYGRNAGRWFNEQFVPNLEFGERGLVFHCLRHTMVTRLAQAGVDETVVKALLGHTQSGVTFNTHFKDGFLATQLHTSINEFAF